MKKKILLIMAFTAPLALAYAQDSTVTLGYCLSQAQANHPLFSQYQLLASSSELKIKNLNKNYLPDMNINGDAHYQSDVTELPFTNPLVYVEPLSKDQYKISLDVSEMIYDGGMTRRNKDVETIDNEINQQNVGIDLYNFKNKVINSYFNIISLQESKELLQLTRENLQSRLKEVESGVRNGTVLASNADIIKAELLKIDQREIEIESGISSGYRVLSILTGDTIPETRKLLWESPTIQTYGNSYQRPEYNLFSLQQQKAESLKKISSSKLIPKVFAYGTAGYGRPGFNMLLNKFDDFYIGGIKLSWNFYNWNKTRNEKSILDLNKEIVESNKKAFDQGLSTELEKKMAEITKIEDLIPKDESIVDLHTGIVDTYSSQLQNGVITATEYITELHAKVEAQLNLKIHQVRLARAKYEYLATAGNL